MLQTWFHELYLNFVEKKLFFRDSSLRNEHSRDALRGAFFILLLLNTISTMLERICVREFDFERVQSSIKATDMEKLYCFDTRSRNFVDLSHQSVCMILAFAKSQGLILALQLPLMTSENMWSSCLPVGSRFSLWNQAKSQLLILKNALRLIINYNWYVHFLFCSKFTWTLNFNDVKNIFSLN